MDFPTVTVCPVEPFDMAILNETAYMSLARYEPNYDEYIPILEMLLKVSYENIDEMVKILESNKVSITLGLRHLVFKIAMKCTDLFHSCRFLAENISCCDYFTPLYSERGFCYSFNARYISREEEE